MEKTLFPSTDSDRLTVSKQVIDASNAIRNEKVLEIDTGFLGKFLKVAEEFESNHLDHENHKLKLSFERQSAHTKLFDLGEMVKIFITQLRMEIRRKNLNPGIFKLLKLHPTQYPNFNATDSRWPSFVSKLIATYRAALNDGLEPLTFANVDEMEAAVTACETASNQVIASQLTLKSLTENLAKSRRLLDTHIRKLAASLRYDLAEQTDSARRDIMRRFGLDVKIVPKSTTTGNQTETPETPQTETPETEGESPTNQEQPPEEDQKKSKEKQPEEKPKLKQKDDPKEASKPKSSDPKDDQHKDLDKEKEDLSSENKENSDETNDPAKANQDQKEEKSPQEHKEVHD